jgi:hypothetical protein
MTGIPACIGRCYHAGMFVFFSDRLGCLGSVIASVILTLVVLAVVRAC